MLLKTYKYHAAGVHEYWIVDPEKRRVTVDDYDRDPDGTEYTVFSFSDTNPVRFSGGSCRIDFHKSGRRACEDRKMTTACILS